MFLNYPGFSKKKSATDLEKSEKQMKK